MSNKIKFREEYCECFLVLCVVWIYWNNNLFHDAIFISKFGNNYWVRLIGSNNDNNVKFNSVFYSCNLYLYNCW